MDPFYYVLPVLIGLYFTPLPNFLQSKLSNGFTTIKNYTGVLCGYTKYKLDNYKEPTKLGRHLLTIPYRFRHQEYFAILPVKSSSGINIISVYNINNRDILHLIKMYLGHNNDFSGANVSPYLLGFDNLTFKYINKNGDVITKEFGFNEYIKFE